MIKIGMNRGTAQASVMTATDRNDVLDLHVSQNAQHARLTLTIAEAMKLAALLTEAAERLKDREITY